MFLKHPISISEWFLKDHVRKIKLGINYILKYITIENNITVFYQINAALVSIKEKKKKKLTPNFWSSIKWLWKSSYKIGQWWDHCNIGIMNLFACWFSWTAHRKQDQKQKARHIFFSVYQMSSLENSNLQVNSEDNFRPIDKLNITDWPPGSI